MSLQTRQLVTLGFSCQSTSTNEMISANTTRSPFDHNVVKKEFLLKLLKTERNPFEESLVNFEIYKQPVSGIEGIRSNGMFFWHDFERNGNLLAENWSDRLRVFFDRYARRWRRFVELCRRKDIQKQFVVSNNQSNLGEFCEGDFSSNFGIDAVFLNDLLRHLDDFGVYNYCIDLTVRDINDYLSLVPIISESNSKCRARFCGAMHLPPHSMIIHETGLDFHNLREELGNIDEVCGLYDCGLRLEKITNWSAIISSSDKVEGEIRVFTGGYVLALSGGFDYFFRATFKDNQLTLSNRHVWTKLF